MAQAENPRAKIGDNSGAESADAFTAAEAKLADWLKGIDLVKAAGDVTAETAEKRRDFYAGIKKFAAGMDRARKDEKEPHLEAGRAVDRKWNALIDQARNIEAVINTMLLKFAKEEKRKELERAEAARAAAAAAEAERQAAERAAARAKTESARIAAEAKAAAAGEREQEALDQAEPEKVRIGSATGLATNLSLKTTRHAVIEEPLRALKHYSKHPKMLALLEQLANEEIRASRGGDVEIPGVRIETTEGLSQ